GLLEGGVDFFFIETMIDLQETRAAVLAVKESCNLPVCASMTFGEDGRTVTGTDPATAVVVLQSLGADAVGCNCSTGPRQMLDIIAAMKEVAKVPLLAKPNAGLPRLVDSKTVFSMEPEEFGRLMKPFAEMGVKLVGGCCGTTPEHIAQIKKNIEDTKPVAHTESITYTSGSQSTLSSSTKTIFPGGNRGLAIIGERINPTGKKALQQELLKGEMAEIHRLAMEQVRAGAEILDVNVGMPGIDEKETMVRVVEYLSKLIDVPLCIDSSNPEAIEAALRVYPGRALVNSISVEKEKMEVLLPITAKYGAMFILLPLDGKGIPHKAEQRCLLIEEGFKKAREYGFKKHDIIADALVMTVSTDQTAPAETLKTIEWCFESFGISTVVGLSNISFGLPERKHINAAFLSMAIDRGLSMAIANPSVESLMNAKYASDVLTGRDSGSTEYVKRYAIDTGKDGGGTGRKSGAASENKSVEQNKVEQGKVEQNIYDAVVEGNSGVILNLVEQALSQGKTAQELVDKLLIPAINHVGDLYDKQKYYLPQLIKSADAMKKAIERLEPMLRQNSSDSSKKRTRIVLATVKGDVHDIGKNIVSLMLKNYGYEVYDLGKDVSAEEIINKAKEVGADIVGLSALMTTTMTEMKKVVEAAKKEGLKCRIMIGGAAVTEAYANEIGADGYSEDANNAVKLAEELS
ncbi:MAG: homocysteine S-methyltransferase family protein, partial [Eubacteriales bacterium]|nr:homocysteine S-methyltransferase family protein [Eubacteriales bacterium]